MYLSFKKPLIYEFEPVEETMTNHTPITRGAHHVGLTVPNLQASQAFFVDSLGYNVLGEISDYPAVFLSDGSTMITLWQAEDPENAVAFDRKNVIGLHHLALTVDGGDELENLYNTLRDTDDVTIEFSPENVGEGPSRHFTVSIPGGIRVEFIAPAN